MSIGNQEARVIITNISASARTALDVLNEAERSAKEFSAKMDELRAGASPLQILELRGLHTDYWQAVVRARQALVDVIASS